MSILAVILSRTSLEDLLARAKVVSPVPLATALLLCLLVALLVTLRWRLLATWLGLAVPPTLALRAVFLGLFGGQLLPSTIGTDLLRGWVITRHTGQIERVAASLIADRLVGLLGACLLLGLSYPAVLGALLLVVLLAWGLKRLHRIQGGLRRALDAIGGVMLQPRPILLAVIVAVAIHAVAIVAAALTAAAYGVDASLNIWLAIIPLSIIACAVPISINGWGVRETVFVALGAAQGLAAADALLVSLTLGALNILASLPGAYLLLRAPYRQ